MDGALVDILLVGRTLISPSATDLAHDLSVPPAVGRVEQGGVRNGDENQQEVAGSKTNNEHVGLGAHRFVGEDDVHERRIADQTDNEDDSEYARKDDAADQSTPQEP